MSNKNKQLALGPLVDSRYFKTLNYIFLNKREVAQPKTKSTKSLGTRGAERSESASVSISLLTIDRALHVDFPQTLDLGPFLKSKLDKKRLRPDEVRRFAPSPTTKTRPNSTILEYRGKTKIPKLFTHWVYSSNSKGLHKINTMLGAGVDVYNYILCINRNTHRLKLSKAELSTMVSQVLYRVQLLKNDKAYFNVDNRDNVLGAFVHFNLKLYFISTDELKQCGLINSNMLDVSLKTTPGVRDKELCYGKNKESPHLPKLLRTPAVVQKFYNDQQVTRLKGPLQKPGSLCGKSQKLEKARFSQVTVYSGQRGPFSLVVRRLKAHSVTLRYTLNGPFKQLLDLLLLPPKAATLQNINKSDLRIE